MDASAELKPFLADNAILGIEQGKWAFFTSVGGSRAKVVVAHHPLLNRKYLTTTPDDYRKNNLLSLAECPPQQTRSQ